MRKIYLMLAVALLGCTKGFAQNSGTSVTEGETVYWLDAETNQKVLNKTKFWDNWFLTGHLGGFWSWGSNTSGANFFEQLRPAFGVSVGKLLAPQGGLRLQAVVGSNRGESEEGVGYKWGTAAGYLDGMFDFVNIFAGYKENRRFNLYGILGLGLEHTFGFSDKAWNTNIFDKDGTTSVGFRAGLMAKFRLNSRWDLSVEAVNNWIDDAYDGQATNNSYDGHINIFAGISYRFKNHDGSRQFTYATRNPNKYDALNEELNRVRAEAAKEVEPNIVIEKKLVKSNQVRTVIAFEDNSSKINKLQQVNVYTAVQAWAEHEGSNIYITMNEDATNVNSELFKARAASIRDMMVNEFQVKAGNIFIEEDPAKVAHLDPERTDVIVYINQ